MYLFIDNREPTELIQLLEQLNVDNQITIFIKALDVGDFILYDEKRETNLLIIERKSLSDMEASIKDGRYTEQSYRLSQMNIPNHNIYYLLEGNLLTYKNNKMLYSCLTSLSYFKGFSILNTQNLNSTAKMIYNISCKINKENNKIPYYVSDNLRNYENNKIINVNTCGVEETNIEENNNDKEYCNVLKTSKKSNITRDNIGSIMLMQIPGVSSQTANAIMKEYNTLTNLIKNLETKQDCLDNIKLESNRKISKSAIKSIHDYLL